MKHLSSPYDLVRTSCAVALGYLSFNKTAARILFSSCRNSPGLYDKLIQNIDTDAKISDEFMQDFERAKKIGLPSQRYRNIFIIIAQTTLGHSEHNLP